MHDVHIIGTPQGEMIEKILRQSPAPRAPAEAKILVDDLHGASDEPLEVMP